MGDFPPLPFPIRFLLRRLVCASSPFETTPSTASFLATTFYLDRSTDYSRSNYCRAAAKIPSSHGKNRRQHAAFERSEEGNAGRMKNVDCVKAGRNIPR